MTEEFYQENPGEELENNEAKSSAAAGTGEPQPAPKEPGPEPEKKPFYVQETPAYHGSVPPYRPSQPSYAPMPAQKPQKVRRVGTFTMGVALIATGVVALLCLFRPSYDIIPILKFAPALLILLGAEILASHLIFRNDKLKYDFLSGLFCFLLILGCAGVATLPPIYERFGPARSTAEYALEQQVEDLCYEQLKGNPSIGGLNTNVSINDYLVSGEAYQNRKLQPIDYVSLHIRILGEYPDAESFAQECRKVLDELNQTGVDFDSIGFSWQDDNKSERRFELNISDRFQADMAASQLSRLVEQYGVERPEDVSDGDSL